MHSDTMSNSKDTMKEQIRDLQTRGRTLYYHAALTEDKLDKKNVKQFKESKEYTDFLKSFHTVQASYQRWYSEAMLVIKQLLPDRIDEFKRLYHDEKRSKDITYLTYSISDYLIGLKVSRGYGSEVNRAAAFLTKFDQQLEILNSCLKVFDSKIANIVGILQSELYESELETAKDALKKKHIRVAGALAGITLEGHLKTVCTNHKIKLTKANPTISDFNEALKSKELIDLPTWRLIQRLGDIRNMSVHSKEREPKPDEIEDLIRGCEKLIAELN